MSRESVTRISRADEDVAGAVKVASIASAANANSKRMVREEEPGRMEACRADWKVGRQRSWTHEMCAIEVIDLGLTSGCAVFV